MEVHFRRCQSLENSLVDLRVRFSSQRARRAAGCCRTRPSPFLVIKPSFEGRRGEEVAHAMGPRKQQPGEGGREGGTRESNASETGTRPSAEGMHYDFAVRQFVMHHCSIVCSPQVMVIWSHAPTRAKIHVPTLSSDSSGGERPALMRALCARSLPLSCCRLRKAAKPT